MDSEFSHGYRAIHPLNKWSKDTKSIMSDLEWWRDDCRTTKLHFKITLLLLSTLSFSKICIHHHNPLYYKLSGGRQARSVHCFCNRKLLLLIPFTRLSTAFILLCFTTLATLLNWYSENTDFPELGFLVLFRSYIILPWLSWKFHPLPPSAFLKTSSRTTINTRMTILVSRKQWCWVGEEVKLENLPNQSSR